MPEDFLPSIRSWLSNQGYPLEMRAARVFQNAGFDVTQGFYYNDPDQGTPREMDVLASRGEMMADLDTRITCVAECKMTQDKPWVSFARRTPNAFRPFSYYSRVASKQGMVLLSQIHRTVEPSTLPEILRLPPNLAYGITQTQRDPKSRDPAFEATTAVAKAAIARAKALESDDPRDLPVIEVILPIVVLQGRLVECTLDPDGDESLTEVGRSLLELRLPIPGRTMATLLHVVTLDELPRVADEAMSFFSFVREERQEEIQRISRQVEQDRQRRREGRGGDS